MTVENDQDLEGIRLVGSVVAETLSVMKAAVAPGITTSELDEIGAGVVRSAGGRSAPRLVYGFPGVNLISVNDEVVHGIPGSRRVQPGDVVKLDVTVEREGYMADAATTVLVPPAFEVAYRLQQCSVAAFDKGVLAARVGAQVRSIGAAVERQVRACGFHVLRELAGHGIGRTIHEPPTVPNYDSRFGTERLVHGMVITIEPLISVSDRTSFTASDGWTIRTRSGSLAAHHEHTMILWDSGPEIVTREAV